MMDPEIENAIKAESERRLAAGREIVATFSPEQLYMCWMHATTAADFLEKDDEPKTPEEVAEHLACQLIADVLLSEIRRRGLPAVNTREPYKRLGDALVGPPKPD